VLRHNLRKLYFVKLTACDRNIS